MNVLWPWLASVIKAKVLSPSLVWICCSKQLSGSLPDTVVVSGSVVEPLSSEVVVVTCSDVGLLVVDSSLSPVAVEVSSVGPDEVVPLPWSLKQWQQSSLPGSVVPQMPFSEVTVMSYLWDREARLSSLLESTQPPRPPNWRLQPLSTQWPLGSSWRSLTGPAVAAARQVRNPRADAMAEQACLRACWPPWCYIDAQYWRGGAQGQEGCRDKIQSWLHCRRDGLALCDSRLSEIHLSPIVGVMSTAMLYCWPHKCTNIPIERLKINVTFVKNV